MAEKTIQIADKPTLDEVKTLLENNGYGLEVLKSSIENNCGIGCKSKIEDNSVILNTARNIGSTGYGCARQGAVVYNDAIHVFISTAHYTIKWNGSSWIMGRYTDLSYAFECACAVVYNNEIHILGGYNSSNNKKHYKWDGSSWTEVSTLPYAFWDGCAVVYNNEIHILGGYEGGGNGFTKHYKWNGSSWTQASNSLPYGFWCGCAVVYNNEIHILGGYAATSASYNKYHYKWSGSSWTRVSTLPYGFTSGSAVVYNNEIHILGGTDYTDFSDYTKYIVNTNHYKWDGSSWIKQSNLPYEFYGSSSGTNNYGDAVVYNDEIHILGSAKSEFSGNHYVIECSAVSIKLYLQTNNKIVCNKEKILPISDNLKEIDNGYVCTQTGLCKLYGYGTKDNIIYTII